MGIFSKELDSSQVLWSTFTTISQAIKVGEDVGMYRDAGIESAEFWALYLWALAPFENKPNDLDPYALANLRHSNTTLETIQEAQNYVFTKSPADYEEATLAMMEVKSALEAKFLTLNTMHNEVFTQDCMYSMTANYQSHFPETYSKETAALIYILTLALRSILIDTMKVNNAEKAQKRKSGFFWISLMLVDWNYKSEINR